VVCPVPPLATAIVVPVHVPDVIVPTLVKLDVTMAAGNAVPAKLAAGNPVVLVKVPLVGVPNIGVTRVGVVDKTTLPVPVDEVTPVPPFKTGNVPVTWVAKLIVPDIALPG